MKTHYLISLEGRPFENSSPPEHFLEHALWKLAGKGHVVVQQSDWYSASAAVMTSRPEESHLRDVITSAVLLESAAGPDDLLNDLRVVEIAIGQGAKLPPTSGFISILLLGVLDSTGASRPEFELPIRNNAMLPLPHLEKMPSLLFPLQEIAPDWVLPDTDKTVSEVCTMLEDAFVARRRSA